MQKDRALSLLIAMESALEDDRFEVGLHHLCDVGSATIQNISCHPKEPCKCMQKVVSQHLCAGMEVLSKDVTYRKQSAYARHSWRSLGVKGPSQLRESSMYNSSPPRAPTLHGQAPWLLPKYWLPHQGGTA